MKFDESNPLFWLCLVYLSIGVIEAARFGMRKVLRLICWARGREWPE